MTSTLAHTKEELKDLLREILNEDTTPANPRFPNHQDAYGPWRLSMIQGTFDGRPFSQHTVENYCRYVKEFFTHFSEISYANLEQSLAGISVEQFGRRDKFYRAIICFAKYLIREDSLSKSFLTKAKVIKPKRHKPPKQNSVNESQLQELLKACKNPYERLIITLLSATGLRASEFCSLKAGDLNLEGGYLIVQNGKWGKRRRVGLNNHVIQLLKEHLDLYQVHTPNEYLFLDAKFEPLTRDGLLNRLYKIGSQAGIHVSPHALRRAFVTINMNKGRSLVMLQMACGHADITTTRSYCQTSEDEMIEAMKEW